MKIVIFGAAGFIGTNLSLALSKDQENTMLLVDEKEIYFDSFPIKTQKNVNIIIKDFTLDDDYTHILKGADIVFHLISTTSPTTSNLNISDEMKENISVTVNILEACVKQNVKRIIFISSGGTVYGNVSCPISEIAQTNPINAYGIQKLTIEKLLYLYHYLYGLDYRIARFSNPYGPYQRPNGRLGALTTFTYKTIKEETIIVYGNGEVIRDYIFIEDAIKALINISLNKCQYKIYNIGSGVGISINSLIKTIEHVLQKKCRVQFDDGRVVDLKENYLDISRYEQEFGRLANVDLQSGIKKTAMFFGEKGGCK